MKEQHDELMKHFGRLQAIRHQIDAARSQLHDRAEEQLASLDGPKQMLEQHVERKGNVLVHRALRKMIAERGRLHHLVLSRRDE